MPQLYFTSTQPPGAHRRIPVRSHDRADPRWNPVTQRKKRKSESPQRNASDNENVLKMFIKMKDMESELSRIKAFRPAECKRTIARLRGQTAANHCPSGLARGRGWKACRAARRASADTRRRGSGLSFAFAAAFAASFTKSEQDLPAQSNDQPEEVD
jgi:hypothetical protein